MVLDEFEQLSLDFHYRLNVFVEHYLDYDDVCHDDDDVLEAEQLREFAENLFNKIKHSDLKQKKNSPYLHSHCRH